MSSSTPTARRRPLSGAGPVLLHQPTDPRWLPLALSRFDEVLVDHAHCEKKAAANALSLIQSYPDLPGLPAQMARLAREESAHLAKVLELLEARGLTLGRDGGDPYAQALQTWVRNGAAERRVDRLLVAAVIEARSCERLSLLAEGLEEPPLKRFYAELAQSEDGHQALFHRLALAAAGGDEAQVGARLESLLAREAEVVVAVGLRAAIH
ncbi:tRNA-(ms[2]io[6]A)-hydroxylase [Aggregicoccus sp. 17bor-14]|uniref:tRNA-(ms[2]io[6]A)-hydroxylase n=1 Tax=Myxococcaceae TaxID=31 RepID=UPI00129C6A1B|nr:MULTISPECIES: tRNA-(ms[2]io[6]A)-hydroxylase [Myxococcaceae]MBF5046551.1 tRNA-(ms[2]io[6]A)-hydroxylase [Simulacricoccus sp. 17bor-14]MRI92262.1 tRNA-(ms[2]io[6]A)-hydroxylase [Aggregicoccus sp. 17bor-14]